MAQTVCIFGRLPKLSIAELEGLYGSEPVTPIGNTAAFLDIDPQAVDFARLGGTVKLCKLLTILDTTDWKKIENFLRMSAPGHAGYLPDGKMRLGLSIYGLDVSVNQLNATALSLKKVIQKTGRSVRVVPNKEPALNSAQVLYNQLTGDLGWELIFIKDKNKTIVAQNIAEQDIEAYSARDQARPKRDSKVGMLPPKLAQTILNLAAGPGKSEGKTVLDPFCGTGVILQEAILMGYNAYGTDIEQRMVDYSKTNLDWLGENFAHGLFTYWLDQADAADYSWDSHFDFIASEAYLGRPFSSPPASEILEETMQTTNLIIKKFLKNVAGQTQPGFRLCVAVPAWKSKDGFKHLKLLDNLPELGYNRVSFTRVENEDLIYHREGQIVARELLVLIRK